MEIRSLYATQNIWEVYTANANTDKADTAEYTATAKKSGDIVDISREARALFSQSQEKAGLDNPQADDTPKSQAAEDGAAGNTAGGGMPSGGAGGTSDSSSTESQIEQLQNRLTSLISQLGKGSDASLQSQIASIQAQIANLKAQIA